MEVLINIPPYLLPWVDSLTRYWNHASHYWSHSLSMAATTTSMIQHGWQHLSQSHAFLPVLAILIFFWPIFLTLIMAIATAWTWIFWLFTSILFGCLQLGYVCYQFVMIAGDLMLLSGLKTYSMLRSQVLYWLDKSGSTWLIGLGRGRRRMWRKRIEEAESYEDFLKVRIADKEETDHWKQTKRELERSKKIDGALPSPVMGRSQSFSVKDESTMNSSPSPKKKLSRNLSFSEKHGNSPEAHFAQTLSHYDNPIVMEELGEKTTDLLVTTTARLKEARMAAEDNDGGAIALKYLLSAVIKRNHLNLDDVLIQNARSIAECGEYGLTSASRKLIRAYYEEVENGLNYLCELIEKIPLAESTTALETARESELMDRITLVRKMKQNMGRTALMLSGGGAQAMYHLGIIRGLIESKQYDNIKVISGTSGGSIIAAMCAICKSDELFKEVCVPEVSTDYRFDGEMKKQNIRWFPSMTEMAAYWVKNKLMVDSAEFRRTCQFYYSDITFEEAFEKTGKHVCITVSASRSHGGGNSAQRLLLNHISTPHVTIASAVAASCALPGVMAPAKLIAKSSTGELEPFEVDGVEWIDGSVQADLPFQRISTLFAVSSFIVSQTNFHIVPFLNKEHHPTKKSKYWQFFQHLEWDIRGRALKLSRLGLFPRIFGQDISKVFKQKYFGDLTLCPRFTTMQVFGLKALSNPSLEDMKVYLKYGQLAAWPYLNAIRDMIRLEKALDECVGRLEGHMDRHDGDWSNQDEIDSIASGSGLASSSARVKIIGRPPIGFTSRGFVEADRNRRRMMLLEDENRKLRDELVKLKSLLPWVDTVEADDESKLESDGPVPLPVAASLSEGSEGAVWSIVLQQKK